MANTLLNGEGLKQAILASIKAVAEENRITEAELDEEVAIDLYLLGMYIPRVL